MRLFFECDAVGTDIAVRLTDVSPDGRSMLLVDGIRRAGTKADFVRTVEEIVSTLARELRPGDRVAILSNGGFGGIHDKLLRALEAAARP